MFKIFNFSFFIFLFSCNLPPQKELNKDSLKKIESIKNELNAESIETSYISKSKNGVSKLYFEITLHDIIETKNIENYNYRLIDAFNLSGYNLQKCDYIVFFYIKNYFKADLYKFYKLDAKTLKIVEEADN